MHSADTLRPATASMLHLSLLMPTIRLKPTTAAESARRRLATTAAPITQAATAARTRRFLAVIFGKMRGKRHVAARRAEIYGFIF